MQSLQLQNGTTSESPGAEGQNILEPGNNSVGQISTESAEKIIAAASPEKVLSLEQQELLLLCLEDRFERHNLDPRFKTSRKNMSWPVIEKRLLSFPVKLWSLNEMERTGGEPDVVGYDLDTEQYIFFDLSAESPVGRTNHVYDRQAEDYLKLRTSPRYDTDPIDLNKYIDEMPTLGEMNRTQMELWLYFCRLLGVEIAELKLRPNEEFARVWREHPELCRGNAQEMAKAMGVKIMNPEEYSILQNYGDFDLFTWSWVEATTEERAKNFNRIGFRVAPFRAGTWSTNAVFHSRLGSFRSVLKI